MYRSFAALAVVSLVLGCAAGGSEGNPDGGTDTGPYEGPTTATWTKSGGESQMGFPINALLVHRGAIYAGWGGSGFTSVGGILVSRDEGVTWSQLTLPEPTIASLGQGRKHIVVALGSDGSRLYAGTSTEHGLLVSDDDGATWQVLEGPPLKGKATVFAHLDGKMYAGTGNSGFFVSSDKAASFTQIIGTEGSTVNPVRGIHSKYGKLWCGSANTVYSFTGDDPGTAVEAHRHGLPFILGLTDLYELGPKLVASTQSNGVYTTSDGETWTKAEGWAGATRDVAHVKTAMFGIQGDTSRGKVVLTTDDGATWLPFDQGLEVTQMKLVATSRTLIVADGTYQLWRTSIE